ncbi:MAG: tetratricopeptide repeat protein [Candidatus Omnitrophota bacterium]
MKRYLLIITGSIAVITIVCFIRGLNTHRPILGIPPTAQQTNRIINNKNLSINNAFILLKTRKDDAASSIFAQILIEHPDNLDALWGKAEILRRKRNYQQAEDLLNTILNKKPVHLPSLNSLAYIKYNAGRLDEASGLAKRVIKNGGVDKENTALAFLMLGSINSKRASEGWIFDKVRFGTQIKECFLKARELSPDLPEVHLGLGTFYLLAPKIIGGNTNKAVEELDLSVKLAPGFATANARLAQAYKEKGNKEKYEFFISQAKSLDPENEVLKQLEEKQPAL